MEILNIRKRREPSIRNLHVPVLSVFNHIASSTYVYAVFSEHFKYTTSPINTSVCDSVKGYTNCA